MVSDFNSLETLYFFITFYVVLVSTIITIGTLNESDTFKIWLALKGFSNVRTEVKDSDHKN